MIYTQVSLKLNKYENHRTDTEYEDSLILKTFAFRYVNNYSPLFYIAFVKPYIQSFDPCTGNDCLKELQISLGTIFISKLLFRLIFTIIFPILSQRSKEKENYRGN